MATPSSQTIRSESEMVPELRPVMSIDLFNAAIKGNSDILVPRLRLQPEEQTEIQNGLLDLSELQSATHFGDTVLHLLVTKRHNDVLVTKRHNELAVKVFERDSSLLKAQNKMLETPLHCAAKVGNIEVIHSLIRNNPAVVKDALQKTNENGDTALHVAIKSDFEDISIKLMKLDPKVTYKVNNKMLTPLYIAIEKERDSIAKNMIEVDRNLACTQFFNGMFPVHFAAHQGNWGLVKHFMKNYPDYAELVDPRGRNFFHYAAEKDDDSCFPFRSSSEEDPEVRMNTAADYEGNTPLHIAAMKGHRRTMRVIWKNEMNRVAETIRNNERLTPFELSTRQLEETEEDTNQLQTIEEYKKTVRKFTQRWFDKIMKPVERPPEDKWEKAQVIGLGSVLITTVTFAAAFTIPRGYNQDDGKPLLGRRYMFRAFIVANALAFIQGFISLFALLSRTLPGVTGLTLQFATFSFGYAASSMVVAFGLGLYVTLAPVSYPLAILLLIVSLILGSPAVYAVVTMGETLLQYASNVLGSLSYRYKYGFLGAFYAASFVLIFCLALL